MAKTGPNARTRKVKKVAAKVMARGGISSTNKKYARHKAREIIKARGKGPGSKAAKGALKRDKLNAPFYDWMETNYTTGKRLKAGRTTKVVRQIQKKQARRRRNPYAKGDTA